MRKLNPLRPTTTCIRAVCLAVVAMLGLAIAPLTATAATETYHSRFSGSSLWAYDYTSGSCYERTTQIFVYLDEAGVRTIYYVQYESNPCIGTSTYSSGAAPVTTYTVATRLESARTVAAVPVTTYSYTPNGIEESQATLNLDLTWTANGPLTKTSNSSTSNQPGIYYSSYKSRGESRPATVTGTLNLAWGGIESTKSGSLTVTHY